MTGISGGAVGPASIGVGPFTPQHWTWKHWSILKYLVRSRLVSSTQNRTLGAIWWVLEPMCMCMIYVFLLEILLQRRQPQFSFFLSCGILPWRWFTTATGGACGSLVQKAGVIKSLRTPKYLFPLAEAAYASVMFLYALPVFGLLMLWYGVAPTAHLCWLPAIMVVQGSYCAGFALLIGGAQVFFRDIKEAWALLTRIWFYMSPCLYPVSFIPEKYRGFYLLNPFASIVPAYRSVIMEQRAPDLVQLSFSFTGGLCFLFVAAWIFSRLSRHVPNYL